MDFPTIKILTVLCKQGSLYGSYNMRRLYCPPHNTNSLVFNLSLIWSMDSVFDSILLRHNYLFNFTPDLLRGGQSITSSCPKRSLMPHLKDIINECMHEMRYITRSFLELPNPAWGIFLTYAPLLLVGTINKIDQWTRLKVIFQSQINASRSKSAWRYQYLSLVLSILYDLVIV